MTKSKLMISTLMAGSMIMFAGQAFAWDWNNGGGSGGGNSGGSSSSNNYKWDWEADVDSAVNINLNINQAEDYLLGELEQVQIGDIKAVSKIDGVLGKELKVDSAATAVGNNMSLEGEEIGNVHTTQFVMDAHGHGGGAEDLSDALDMTDAALGGGLDQAEVKAYSEVMWTGGVKTVDATSTAISNNLSFTVNPGDTESVAIADASQFSFADVTAVTQVGGVASGWGNPGAKVNAAASAIGNNISVKVGLDD